MRYYVVSPNVKKYVEQNEWLELIQRTNCVFMGYGPDDSSGNKFFNISKGDLVLVAQGANENKRVFICGLADSKAQYNLVKDMPSEAQGIQLTKVINKQKLNSLNLDFSGCAFGESKQPRALYELYPETNDNDKRVVDILLKEINEMETLSNIQDLLFANKNLILTGAPGTGKTYLAYQVVSEIILTNFESYLSSCQVETKGVIGALTEDTKRQYLLALKQIPNNINITLIELITKSSSELQTIKERYSSNGDLKNFDSNGNKSAVIGKLIEFNPLQFFSFVQFHPSYDYTDFVEGLRPKKEIDSNEIGFELKNGIFKQFCIIAKSNPDYDFIFIIDEINRGEISKIFGELFFSMDPGYRGEKGKVKTQFANMQTKDTFFTNIDDDYFYIPKRVYIIGTMNDIDRSVESFDFAMRRRFVWKEIKPEDTQNMLDTMEYADKRKINAEIIKTRMNNLNIIISKTEELGPHYNIGAAYFLKLANYNGDIDKLWELHLEPLLREYLRGLPDVKDKLEKMKNAYKTETPIDETNI